MGRPGVTRWSVIMQRQFQQFVELFVLLVQFVDRMVDIPAAFRSWYAQCTSVLQTVEISQVQFLGGCGRACCFSMTGALVRSCSKLWSLRSCRSSGGRAMRVRRWIHVMHHPGWLVEDFSDFLHDWVDSAPEVDSPSWPAYRRQRQWLPCWFCWY